MGVKVEAEQVAKIHNPVKFLKWPNFLQFVALISIQLMTRISDFGLDSSCMSRLNDVSVFRLYNYKK